MSPRDHARLLVVSGEGYSDRYFYDLPSFLDRGDMLVFNNSPVMSALLEGRTDEDRRVEVLLCAPMGGRDWQVMMRGGLNSRIYFSDGVFAEAIDERVLRFNVDYDQLRAFLWERGKMPLPPYISKRRGADNRDKEDYRTIYEEEEGGQQDVAHWGSIAAPTAGLHFTPEVMTALEAKGVELLFLTLHVGAGTFLPVRQERIAEHQMQAERAMLSEAAADAINCVKASGGRIIPVGTTSLRLLESATDDEGRVRPFEGETDLFITPGYCFKVIDGMVTNFHLPRSTPLMLVSALLGLERTRRLYRHAIQLRYRFFSYGDACLCFLR